MPASWLLSPSSPATSSSSLQDQQFTSKVRQLLLDLSCYRNTSFPVPDIHLSGSIDGFITSLSNSKQPWCKKRKRSWEEEICFLKLEVVVLTVRMLVQCLSDLYQHCLARKKRCHLDLTQQIGTSRSLLLDNYCPGDYLSAGNKLFSLNWCNAFSFMWKDPSCRGKDVRLSEKGQIIGIKQIKCLRRLQKLLKLG